MIVSGHLMLCNLCRLLHNAFHYCSALEALINFAYSGRVVLDNNNVQSVMVGASFLHLNQVMDACADFIKRRQVQTYE